MKKAQIFLFVILFLFPFVSLVYAQDTTPPQSISFPPPVVEEIDEDEFDFLQDPEIETKDVESFYGSFGFNIIPKKRNFSLRNILKNTINYNDNIYYSHYSRYIEDDVVYTLSMESQLEYKPIRQLVVGLSAGFSFEQYIKMGENKIVPVAELEVKFKEGGFYANFRDKFFRNTALITGEVNVFSPWFRNHAELATGFNYERWLFEMKTFHEYQNYEKFDGDYQFFGQTYTVGYQLTDGIYATLAYRWDRILYQDAISILQQKIRKYYWP